MKLNKLAVALIAFSVLVALVWFAQTSVLDPDVETTVPNDKPAAATTGIIKLTDRKLAVAGIRTEPVRVGNMNLTRTLSARFAYDETRHVCVRAPTDGVLQEMLVQPGDQVTVGSPVAVLRSPDIGLARSQVLTQQTTVDLAEAMYKRQSDLHDGVTELADRIRNGQSVDSTRRDLADKSLGAYGGTLLNAYTQSQLAGKIVTAIDSAGDSGAISGRVVRERQSQQQQADASLEAAIEQSLFQTEQARAKAKADAEQARREWLIAKQTLRTLTAATPASADGLDVSPNDPDVSRLVIKSPLTGTVESKSFSATERVSGGDELYIIADTTHLWVEADIRGRDWDSIHVSAGDTVSVTTPSVDGPPQRATVLYIGRRVDPASGAIPLVARIKNTEGTFRPGQFARVEVPTKLLEQAVIVPESAIVEMNGQDNVFVQRPGGFMPIAVEVGSRSDRSVEIRSGLNEGDSVVVDGAFTLKSELLLEGEE